MAIKDWHKQITNEKIILQYRYKNTNNFITIFKFFTRWEVTSGFSPDFRFKSKRFKTKSKALKFAKAYMRKN